MGNHKSERKASACLPGTTLLEEGGEEARGNSMSRGSAISENWSFEEGCSGMGNHVTEQRPAVRGEGNGQAEYIRRRGEHSRRSREQTQSGTGPEYRPTGGK